MQETARSTHQNDGVKLTKTVEFCTDCCGESCQALNGQADGPSSHDENSSNTHSRDNVNQNRESYRKSVFLPRKKVNKSRRSSNRSGASSESAEAKFCKIQAQIKEAFDILDPDETGYVDNRQFKTLVYALHRVPNKNQLDDMFETVQDDKNADLFPFDKFEKMMIRVMTTDRYRSATAKDIETAFNVLDTDRKGFFTVDELTSLLTSSGEPFTAEELAETLKMAVDPETETFVPSKYLRNLVVGERTY
ncbi:Dynein regulatory complex protein 8 [Bulinus truncatus]|nr:Dynein regulatory complex protein 8 [Bulinus truncatus]